jgi:hypothetical protein
MQFRLTFQPSLLKHKRAPASPKPTPQSIAPATSDNIDDMRKGLARIDQQRRLNNLDRKPGEEAPMPTGPGREPTNARRVARHAAKPRKARGWNGPPATLETINGVDYIVLRLPMAKQPKLSKSAKSHIIGSTRGRRRVWHVDGRTGEKTPVTVNGIHVCAIATAYAVLRESPEADTV